MVIHIEDLKYFFKGDGSELKDSLEDILIFEGNTIKQTSLKYSGTKRDKDRIFSFVKYGNNRGLYVDFNVNMKMKHKMNFQALENSYIVTSNMVFAEKIYELIKKLPNNSKGSDLYKIALDNLPYFTKYEPYHFQKPPYKSCEMDPRYKPLIEAMIIRGQQEKQWIPFTVREISSFSPAYKNKEFISTGITLGLIEKNGIGYVPTIKSLWTLSRSNGNRYRPVIKTFGNEHF